MRKWTDQQLQAMEQPKGHILVSAAAGSGKTAVLVERIVRKITDIERPVDVDRFLVMTFTNAAADEMKGRLRERLILAINEEKNGEEMQKYLRRQLTLLDNAWISTTDSAALRILREHTDKAGIDPAFRIADENEITLIRNDVMERFLEEKYEEASEEFIDLVESYTEKNDGRGLSELILSLCSCSRGCPWPGEWFEKVLDPNAGEGRDEEYIKYIFIQVKELLCGYRDDLMLALDICTQEGGPAPYIPVIEGEISMIAAMLEAGSYPAMTGAAANVTYARLPMASKSKYDEEAIEAVKSLRNDAKAAVLKIIEKYLSYSEETLKEYSKKTAPYLRTLITLARDFSERFRQARRDRCVLSIGEPAYMVLDILYDRAEETINPKTDIGDVFYEGHVRSSEAAEYAQRFEEIYVDEYQDSNYVQEALLAAIDSGNTFMVGDVKQSIYRFRGAVPELFINKQDCFKTGEKSHGMDTATDTGILSEDTLIRLSWNFRSRKGVLDGVNRLFRNIMGGSVGGVDYTPDAELVPKSEWMEYPDVRDDRHMRAGNVRLLLARTEDAAGEDKRILEARMIAGHIRELTDPDTGMYIYDRKTGSYRTARYSDIVILLRSPNKLSSIYVNVLGDIGIPAYSRSGKGYFDSLEVRTVLAILEATDNPMKDIPLAAYLKSPAAGITDEELACICASSERQKGSVYTLYDTVRRSGGKAAAALLRLDSYREAAGYMSLAELVTYIYDDSGYYDYASALPSGNVRRANLDKLRSMATDYQGTGYSGLSDFLRYVNTLKSYDIDMSEAQTSGALDDAVSIMSIHKSKGLEFPIVFVSALDIQFNMSDEKGRVLCDMKLGPACEYVDAVERTIYPSLKRDTVALKKRSETLGEEIRILYVAMTRASEQLYLTAAVGDTEKLLRKSVNNGIAEEQNSGYIGLSRILRSASFLDLYIRSGAGFDTKITDTAQLITAQTEKVIRDRSFEKLLSAADTGHGEWEGLCGYSYPYQAETSLTGKISVSEIKRRWMEGEISENTDVLNNIVPGIPADPDQTADEVSGYGNAAKYSGSRRGTVYHTVMENIDFGKVTDMNSLNEYIEALITAEKLTAEEAAMINRNDILVLLGSKLGERIARAQADGRLKRERQFIMGLPARQLRMADSDEPIVVQGIIDAYIEDEDGITLIDYKTDRIKTIGMLKERYKIQLKIYKKALEMMKQRPVKEMLIWSFALGETVKL